MKEDIIKLFIDHHNTCPYCKNKNTWGAVENGVKIRECSCNAKFVPCPPTDANLQRFFLWLVSMHEYREYDRYRIEQFIKK